ncbi:NfeD family protein [Paenibacillus albidus]|uniref:NfeD family protein n=1 Tax=Paenibacillus albidus TaxID=2041023 RepID=UPI001BEAA75F|nr:NfeD family protein [Paenibacillus albidus]MBT2290263.1 NfeD family protein [Paenibacillus albidus]
MVVFIVWLIAAGVLFVVEMMTLTFYLLWLSIGALAAGLVAWIIPGSILLQVVTGSLVALGLTLFSKPLVAKFRSSRGFKDTGTDIVGRQGVVLEDIVPGRYGQVKVGGDTWSATSLQVLNKNEAVRVIKRGTTIIEVERWGE